MNAALSNLRSDVWEWFTRGALLLGALALLLCANPRVSLADDASLGRWGESVRPILDGQVEMVEEYVTVRVTPRDSYVTCRFVFRNTGPATKVLMGFPEEAPDPADELRHDVAIHDFKAWVRGREVAVEREKGLDYPEEERNETGHNFTRQMRRYSFWWTWSVLMQAGETLEVRNSYRVRNMFVSDGQVRTGYILRTGAGWMGPIGKARVVFEFAGPRPYEIVRAYPASYRFEGDSIVWEWSGFEPAADIDVALSPRPGIEQHRDAMIGQPAPESSNASPADKRSDLFWKIFDSVMRWDNAGALRLVRQFGALSGLSPEALEAASVMEARLRFLTGDRSYGKAMWKERIESGAASAEEYYFLGSLYREFGDGDGLADLYRRLCETVPPVTDPSFYSRPDTSALWTVRRWLASHLKNPAPGEFGSGRNEPVIEKVTIEPRPDSPAASALFRAVVSDDDGDLAYVRWRVWTAEGGSECVLADTVDDRYTGGRRASPEIVLSLPSPLATVYCRVAATDMAGHTADSGIVEWSIDEGTPLGSLDVDDLERRLDAELGRAKRSLDRNVVLGVTLAICFAGILIWLRVGRRRSM